MGLVLGRGKGRMLKRGQERRRRRRRPGAMREFEAVAFVMRVTARRTGINQGERVVFSPPYACMLHLCVMPNFCSFSIAGASRLTNDNTSVSQRFKD